MTRWYKGRKGKPNDVQARRDWLDGDNRSGHGGDIRDVFNILTATGEKMDDKKIRETLKKENCPYCDSMYEIRTGHSCPQSAEFNISPCPSCADLKAKLEEKDEGKTHYCLQCVGKDKQLELLESKIKQLEFDDPEEYEAEYANKREKDKRLQRYEEYLTAYIKCCEESTASVWAHMSSYVNYEEVVKLLGLKLKLKAPSGEATNE